MSASLVDINVDVGEGFGRWSLGDDAALMPYVSSVNIACGFHAGDPATMRRTVEQAVRNNLQVGAHVGFPDLLGFGRRRMSVEPAELKDYCTYQIGALQAFVKAAGGRLGHVKPHGAMYVMASDDANMSGAIAAAIAECDSTMPLLLLSDKTGPAVSAHGVRLVTEAFPDLHYDANANLIIERVKQAWSPDVVARRALRIVKQGLIESIDGVDLAIRASTLCIHGDAPNAVTVARTVAEQLRQAQVQVVSLARVLAG